MGWEEGSDWINLEETRWCRRIINNPFSADLEWAIETGPIKVNVITYSEVKTKFFEHSTEGMEEAFKYAKSLLKPSFVSRILNKIFK